jgi:hypothetical protein
VVENLTIPSREQIPGTLRDDPLECPVSHLSSRRMPTMQRMLIVFTVLSTLVIGASVSQAQTSRQEIGAARKGPVAKLVELERRKNEWLREKFLGR